MFFNRKKSKNKPIELLAEEGDAEACYKLGLKFYNGEDGEYDFQKAVQWFEKAASGGCEKAYFPLGGIYKFGGHGVLENQKKAAEYYLKAYDCCVDDDKLEIEESLGFCYYSLQDEENALRWARRYAKCGEAQALSSYGAMLYDYERYDEAFDVLNRASNLGDDFAAFTLGECYFYGYGVAENKPKAKELWEKAAEEGLEDAENALKEHFGEEN